MVEVMKIMETFLKRSHACTATLGALNPAAGHHRPMPLLETPRHSWASLNQSLVGSLLLSPASWCPQGFVCALQEKGGVTPQQTDPDLPVSGSLQQRCGSEVACHRVGHTECSSTCMGSFEGGHLYLHDLHHSLAPGKYMVGNTAPAINRKLD